MLAREDRMFRRFRRTGDLAALAEVFDRTAPELVRLARLLVGRDAAEDLVQTTFVAAIDSAARFDPERPVRPWLCGLLANHAKRHRQSLRREHEALRRAAPREERLAVSAAELAAADEGLTRIRAAAADCGEPYASVLRLHLEEGLNAKEIAARLGRPSGTVRTQLVRALDRLRRRLGPAASAAVVLSPTPGLVELVGVRSAVLGHANVAAPQVAAAGAAAVMVTGTGAVMVKYWFGAVAVVAAVLLAWTRPWQAAIEAPIAVAELPAEAAAGPVPAAADAGTRRIAAPMPSGPVIAPEAPLGSAADDVSTITGRVLDVAGRPLADARLFIKSWTLFHADDHEPNGSVASSDVAGRFAFDVAASGPRQVSALQLEARCDGYEVAETRCSPSDGEVEFRLFETRCRLRGQVLDLDGRPVPRVEVALQLWRAVERQDGRAQALTLWTDDRGRFDAGWMPAGHGLAYVSSEPSEPSDEGGAADWVASAPFDLVARPVDEVMLRGVPPACLEVRVHDVSGRPIRGAQMWAVCADARFAHRAPAQARAETGAEGVASLTPLLPGRIHLAVRIRGEQIDAEIALGPGEHVQREVRFDVPIYELDVVLEGVSTEQLRKLFVHARDPRRLSGFAADAASPRVQPDEAGIARFTGLRGDLRYRIAVVGARGELASRDLVDPSLGTLVWNIGGASYPAPTGGLCGLFSSDSTPLFGTVILTMQTDVMTAVAMEDVAPDGRFQIGGIMPGTYTLVGNFGRHEVFRRTVDIAAGRTFDIGTLPLRRFAMLNVNVRGLTAEQASRIEGVFWDPWPLAMRLARDPARPGALSAQQVLPGRKTVAIFLADAVPIVHEVDVGPGENHVEFPRPEPGTPVRLDLYPHASGAVVSSWTAWSIFDARGERVAADVGLGDVEDPRTGRITRAFALTPGSYRAELTQRFEGGDVTVDARFTVGDEARVVTLRIDR